MIMYVTLVSILFTSLIQYTYQFNSICSTDFVKKGYKIKFFDDFNEDQLNSLFWTITEGPHDSQYREALGLQSNVYIEDGALVLRSMRNKTEHEGKIYEYTSGAVTTLDKLNWKHGVACIVAKLPGITGKADGIWPAHWMLPSTYSCSPDLGEFDIMEMINGDDISYGTYHWSRLYPEENCTGSDGETKISGNIKINNWNNDWHEYAVEWDGSNFASFYVDAILVNNVTISSTDSKYNAHPKFSGDGFYMILNTALGGGWPKPITNETIFPVYHIIDKVTVLQKQ